MGAIRATNQPLILIDPDNRLNPGDPFRSLIAGGRRRIGGWRRQEASLQLTIAIFFGRVEWTSARGESTNRQKSNSQIPVQRATKLHESSPFANAFQSRKPA